jgi:ClpP class serine protease
VRLFAAGLNERNEHHTREASMASAAESGPPRSWVQRLGSLARLVFWVLLVGLLLLQVTQSGRLSAARAQVLERFQDERKSRVIALIHRQDTVSILGVPVTSYIDIDDSEALLRVIRLTPPEQPIDVILHTPGGLVLAAEQIARALAEHKGKVTVFVPHYAMSGGTLIALAADAIVMDPNAVLGPVDPQIGELPAASIVKVLEIKKPDRVSDIAVIMADMAQKARVQVNAFVTELLLKHYPEDKAKQLATTLSEGRWTHDFPITVPVARSLGIQVTTDMPRTVYDLMDLYPQAQRGRPSVLYVPLRRGPAGAEETPAAPPSKSSEERG